MRDLMSEVARFRLWADAYPIDRRSGEWECDYAGWNPLYEAVLGFVSTCPFPNWSSEELRAVLYAVARDNEMQHLAREIRSHTELLVCLGRAAAEFGERDAKWQLAEELGHLGQSKMEAERLLVLLASDADEYVRRRSLGALARLNSSSVVELALAEWHRPDEHQQWSRMKILWCLHRVGSPLLESLLAEAERDERPHLSEYAKRFRQGKIDD